MPKEGEPTPLSAIRIDLKDRSIIFEAEDQPIARLSLAPEGLVFTALHRIVEAEARAALPAEQAERSEKEKTVTLTGRLKTEPKEGKADSRGNPTAWARLAVHEEGREDAHVYLASFHRHTAPVALSLAKDAQVTVSGYPHPSNDPSGKRMDTFSVVNLVSYPGKQDKGKRGNGG